MLGIHEAYKTLQGGLLQYGVHVAESTLYRKLIAHSNEQGHVYRTRHKFSEENIRYVLHQTLANHYKSLI